MRHLVFFSILIVWVSPACGGRQTGAPSVAKTKNDPVPRADQRERSSDHPRASSPVKLEPGETNEFELRDSDSAASARGERPSAIEPTATEAAMRLIVVDKSKGPIQGIVIKLTAPDGTHYYTEETDRKGYAEVLVPVGQKYELQYLSLGRRKISAKVPVPDEPKQNIKLTLRYKRHDPPRRTNPRGAKSTSEPSGRGFVLKGVHFDTGKATLRAESFSRLDEVLEYMTHKRSVRIEIAGHTDDVGKPRINKALSKKRAQAVRNYLTAKGIAGDRIEVVGYGHTHPIASNETDEGRQKNRRIVVREL